MELAVFNIEGAETGRTAQLADEVFALEQPNDHAIYMDVRQMQANARQGTHKAKERGEVAASTKKLYRQKGTGNARSGSRKSPVRKSGGTIFGPRPRDYSFRLNTKIKSLARKSALTYKARSAEIRVVENLAFDLPKTRQFLAILKNLSLEGQKVLVVLPEYDRNVYLSGRNLPKTQVTSASEINTIDILHADTLVLTEGAVQIINQRLAN
ncbi:MAG: 50S ribosomal protein L4 [Bacteroidia bacterium]|nr:50S ribosomal protein L4 [Bacteroidia bacterium]